MILEVGKQRLKDFISFWGKKTVFNLLDQGLFSGTNFITSILLARWVSPSEYGTYAIAFSIFLLIAGIHSAFVYEPMAILGPKYYLDDLPLYLSQLLKLHFLLSIIISMFMIVILNLLPDSSVMMALEGVAIGFPFILMFWLLRLACYINLRSNVAFLASVIYLIFNLVGYALMNYLGVVSIRNAFIVTGLASILPAIAVLLLFPVKISITWKDFDAGRMGRVIKHHWPLSRWFIGASVADWMANYLYYPIIAIILGLSTAGAVKAFQNFFQPIQQILRASYLMLQPWLATQFESEKRYDFLRRVTNFSLLIALVLVVMYSFFIIVISDFITSELLTNDYYEQFRWVIPLLGVILFINTIIDIIGISIRAMENAKSILIVKLSSTIVFISFGIIVVRFWQLIGFFSALICAGLVGIWISRKSYLQLIRENFYKDIET